MTKLGWAFLLGSITWGCGGASEEPANQAGSSSAGTLNAGASGNPAGGDGGSHGGTAGGGMAGAGGTSGSGTTSLVSGTIKLVDWIFSERPAAGGAVTCEVKVRFRVGPVEFDGCTRHDAGPCFWVECPGLTASTPTIQPNAGALSYTAENGTQSLGLDFDGLGFGATFEGSLWTASGEEVSVTIEGGADVPAYSGSVTAPSNLSLLSPTIPLGATIVLPSADDMPISWSGGDAGTAVFTLRGPTSGAPALVCEFPASDGAGSIPAVALQALAGEPTYLLYFYSRHRVVEVAGDWTVWVGALHYPTAEFSVSPSVTIQ